MSLAYPPEAIAPDHRCPTCDGSGDDWQEVAPSLWEPVAECPACHGSGLRPGAPSPAVRDARRPLVGHRVTS
jgi:DnaJ-class molecular chaperone